MSDTAPFNPGDRVWWPAVADHAVIETCTFTPIAGWWATGRTEGGRKMRTHAGNLKRVAAAAPVVRLTWSKPRLVANLGEILG